MNEKKVCVVMVGNLHDTPPALSLIQALDNQGYNVNVFVGGNYSKIDFIGYQLKNVNFKNVIGDYMSDISLINKFGRLFKIRKKLWRELDSDKNKDSLIIVISEVTIKHLGEKIIKRKFIYYQLELVQIVSMVPGIPLLNIDIKKIASAAKKVIVCEYNRAHITKAWWGLNDTPEVLMNKPYVPFMQAETPPESVLKSIKKVEQFANGRKIIVYQGIVTEQRPISPFIEAAGLKKDEYCFVLVSNKEPENIKENDFYMHVPFIKPPFHMMITELADIGVLVYTYGGKSAYSELNPIYCAPNKIWEYAKYGKPMVSNDIPALKYEFALHKIGYCVDYLEPIKILHAYDKIISCYDEMSNETLAFYDSYEIDEEIKRILGGLNE